MARTTDIKELRAHLEKQGFHVEVAKNGHYRVIAPDGRKIQIAATPRYPRAVLNAITRLKRIGYNPAL